MIKVHQEVRKLRVGPSRVQVLRIGSSRWAQQVAGDRGAGLLGHGAEARAHRLLRVLHAVERAAVPQVARSPTALPGRR